MGETREKSLKERNEKTQVKVFHLVVFPSSRIRREYVGVRKKVKTRKEGNETVGQGNGLETLTGWGEKTEKLVTKTKLIITCIEK